MKKVLKVMLCIAVIAAICMIGDAYAQNDGLFGKASTKLQDVFNNVRKIVYILGGFALIGFAIAAIFGKLEWKKVAILAVGLALLVAAGEVVKYAVKSDTSAGNVDWETALGDGQ